MNILDDGSKSAGYVRGYIASQDEIAALRARVRALESGLREYGQHRPDCWYLPRAAIEGGDTEPCICGLAALAGEG